VIAFREGERRRKRKEKMIWKSYVSGPKSACFDEFLFDVCTEYNLDFTILHRDKGWFREKIFFQVEGSEENILKLKKIIVYAIKNHNEKTE
jgi:hypothetical protein